MRVARPLPLALSLLALLAGAACDDDPATVGTQDVLVPADGLTADSAVEADSAADALAPGDTLAADTSVAPDATRHHPEGFAAPAVHGAAFNAAGPTACGGCHGAALDGGPAGVGCATCHAAASADWSTDCTFCHGGADNDTGAPPEAVDGESAPSFLGVGAHSAHVVDTAVHAAFACTTCHPATPDSIFAAGHIDGDGVAENAFGGVAAGASFERTAATCSALYCHGNGRTSAGTAVWTSTAAMACNSCHRTDGTGMSGEHRKHLSHNVKCQSCHGDVATGSAAIKAPALHVDGSVSVKLSQGTWDAASQRCSATCHGTKTW